MKKILILIENFFPAYKGGGPNQSITNLVITLQKEYSICVVTSAYDLQSNIILQGISINTWNNILLPNSHDPIMVWYSDKQKPGYHTFKKMINSIKPNYIYLNGIFSYNLFLMPLLALKFNAYKPKTIISPRGMLQKGALSDKKAKKKFYLAVLKLTGLIDKSVWHATSQEEKEDIHKYFSANSEVIIALNIPKRPSVNINCLEKFSGNLKLIYLSLITEKKNLLFLLKLIQSTQNISLDIFGPIKDSLYWNECKKLINIIPDKVKYLGCVLPSQVQETFSNYHASILLTKGENFGHALYESLSVGTPIITSYFTPWKSLENEKAGWNLNISNPNECLYMLNAIKEMSNLEFMDFCHGAHKQAKLYYNESNDLSSYQKLFSA